MPRRRARGPPYWRDRNSKFHRFPPIPSSPRIVELLAEVDADRTGIFWG
jgi:hypothetical protein